MAAFRAALEHGYGIELDIHLMKDGNLAVMHDCELKRTTGCEGKITDLTIADLEHYHLGGTDETIPTFRQVLDLTPRIASAMIAPTEAELMTLTAQMEKEKALTVGVLAGLALILRDAIVCKYGGTTTLSTSPEVAAQLAARLTAPRLTALMEQVEHLQFAHSRNMNNNLFLTRFCACLRQAAGY